MVLLLMRVYGERGVSPASHAQAFLIVLLCFCVAVWWDFNQGVVVKINTSADTVALSRP